jgi:hypothetical protein
VSAQIEEARAEVARVDGKAGLLLQLSATLTVAGAALLGAGHLPRVALTMGLLGLCSGWVATTLLIYAVMPVLRGGHGIAAARSGEPWGEDADRLAWLSARAMDGFRLVRWACWALHVGMGCAVLAGVMVARMGGG